MFFRLILEFSDEKRHKSCIDFINMFPEGNDLTS